MAKLMKRLWSEEQGQDIAEYAGMGWGDGTTFCFYGEGDR